MDNFETELCLSHFWVQFGPKWFLLSWWINIFFEPHTKVTYHTLWPWAVWSSGLLGPFGNKCMWYSIVWHSVTDLLCTSGSLWQLISCWTHQPFDLKCYIHNFDKLRNLGTCTVAMWPLLFELVSIKAWEP